MGESGFTSGRAGCIVVCIAAGELRTQVTDFLSRSGFSVVETESGTDLRKFAEREVALLLADTRIEQALNVVREAARLKQNMQVLLISGEPESINKELVPDPWVHFIEKPFAWCELHDRIAWLLRPAAGAAGVRTGEPVRTRVAA